MIQDALKKLAGNMLSTDLCDKFTAHAALQHQFKSLANVRSYVEREHLWNFAFLGCNSFEGLPENWGPMAAGGFSAGGRTPETKDPRVQFVKGWFQNSFDEAIGLAREILPNPEAILIHFDADLYSSTLFLLSQLYNELDRYYFIFDEFTGDETPALLNFQQAYGSNVEFCSSSNYVSSTLPAQVFGVLDNRMNSYRTGTASVPNAAVD